MDTWTGAEWIHGPVMLETDCARVAMALCADREDRSYIGFLIAEGKRVMNLLDRVDIVKVNRESNQVAHELAQLARKNTHTAVWLRQAPACVHDLIKSGCTSTPI